MMVFRSPNSILNCAGREISSARSRPGIPSFRVANLIRDRQLLEAAKREAAFVVAGPNAELSKEEIDRALKAHADALVD